MRILMLHNRYRQPGGEDASFEADAALLEQHGHEVRRLEESNERLAGMSPPRAFLRTVWSPESARRVRREIREFRPDLVHVQNFFAVFSPSVHRAASGLGVPVVQTLHNYRLVCPNAQLLRDGRVCELCKTRRLAWPAVRYACYRGSRAASAAVAAMLAVHRAAGTWRRGVSRFVALTDFSKRVFVEGGLPETRIAVRPNFLGSDPGAGSEPRSGIVFVGMLHPWKGAALLLDAWRRAGGGEPLTIAGSGPEEPALRRLAGGDPDIRFAGRLEPAGVFALLRRARVMVFPSLWYETFGRTILEAHACATPVIASRLGAAAELVAEGETGWLFRPGDPEDLAARIRAALSQPAECRRLGEAARQTYLARFTPGPAYDRLMEIYQSATATRAAGSRPGGER